MSNSTPRLIDGASSVILDTLRILAALVVFIYHIFYHWLPSDNRTVLMSQAAHGGVVIFFVLSGFVIAYTTTQRNRGGMQYLQARFSRLYSVVLPALLITALVQLAVYHLDTNLYLQFTRGLSFPRYLLSALFVNEIWFLSAAPPINSPLWSLSYEFWYYIIFGLFLYKSQGWKWLLPGILGCLIAGPKILLMMPIWLCGYFAYTIPRLQIHRVISWLSFFILLALAFLAITFVPPFPFKIGEQPLVFAGQFLTDWFTGLFVACALWIMPAAQGYPKQNMMIKYIRNLADVTFPVYVLHYPIIILYDAFNLPSITKASQLWLPLVCISVITFSLGFLLEKFRSFWSHLFKQLFSKLNVVKTNIFKPTTLV